MTASGRLASSHTLSVLCALCGVAVLCSPSLAENAVKPLGEPVLDPPTLHSLGVYWIVQGDDNKNAAVQVEYRKQSEKDWRKGYPLFRVDKGAQKGAQTAKERNNSDLDVPLDAWLFAGSVVLLTPDTEYEVKLTLADPDGGASEKLLKCRTLGEPVVPKDAPQYHVVPGAGGGAGTPSNPFKGLDAAQRAAKPGDLLLLHAGVYEGAFNVTRSGEEGKPIVWRGDGDGEAILDGMCPREKLKGTAVDANGVHDVWFEKLTIRNAHNLVRAHESSRIVVRRCRLTGGIVGVFATVNDKGKLRGLFIADNVFEGHQKWPTTQEEWKAGPEARAVWIGGRGNVVCYNRIHHWKDGMDTNPNSHSIAIDFHNNEVSECFDDGTEMDGSERNTRCFFNRYTNVFQGVSVQPVFGGPVYVFRNALYNCQVEPFKMHNNPSGALFFHNTVAKKGPPTLMQTPEKVFHCVSRNNLFIGTEGRALHFDSPMVDCDFDYDGFGGFSGDVFLKWNNVRYATPDEVRAKCPVYKHLVLVDPAAAFASGVKPPDDNQKVYPLEANDLRLKPGTAAVDSGEVLPNFNDGFTGRAPDLGAYELGSEPPHYGPRPEK